MPDKNKTEIAIILDRSGSMAAIMDDMEGGFKTFIEEQKAVPGEAVVSLYQFDDHFEVCFEERPLAEVTELGLKPRGMTALLDAVGKAITLIGERLAAKPEEERPGGVVVLIITDGFENASDEFGKPQILEMVKRQSETYKWQFAYLGADASTFDEAASIGVACAAIFDLTPKGVQQMYGSTSRGVASYRASVADGAPASLDIPSDGDE